jgi:hypothetical protein
MIKKMRISFNIKNVSKKSCYTKNIAAGEYDHYIRR